MERSDADMTLSLRVPGKAFLFGEYGALQGGAALLYSGPPYFHFQFSSSSRDLCLHQDSPAFRWLKMKSLSQPVGAEIYYPSYIESPFPQGGWGQSSAEFVAVLKKNASHQFSAELIRANPQLLLNEYHRSFLIGNGNSAGVSVNLPSGYDVLAQFFEGYVLISQGVTQVKIFKEWPFPDLVTYLIPTGIKVKTHEYLDREKVIVPSSLTELCSKLSSAFEQRDSLLFLELLKAFRLSLQSLGWEELHTIQMIEDLESGPGFTLAKGCGAMGADFLYVLVKRHFLAEWEKYLNDFLSVWNIDPNKIVRLPSKLIEQ
ncbi:MAG: hypothetical protein NZ480_01385 [Bdellovibrionaceae bacterium]|nr:hypothetical protein [Pseudobdellovibrionaceae bacterium]MDW8190712.1 hypothetical protein [Pseudobdellovibrionaceae bacterium]